MAQRIYCGKMHRCYSSTCGASPRGDRRQRRPCFTMNWGELSQGFAHFGSLIHRANGQRDESGRHSLAKAGVENALRLSVRVPSTGVAHDSGPVLHPRQFELLV